MESIIEEGINTLVQLYETSRKEKLKWKIEGYCMALKDSGYKLRWDASAKHYEVHQEGGENNEEEN